jgi:hypothetical protein
MKCNYRVCLLFAFLLLAGPVFELHPQVKLNDGQQALVASSRKAIIATGITESYFDNHFTLLKVFNESSDKRVMWKFALNGYEAIINDSIGSTSVGNAHSVSRTLGQVTEFTKTISRPVALKALKRCIGNYSQPYVEFGQVNGRAELFLVGTHKTGLNRQAQAEAMERERDEAVKRSRKTSATDEIEREEGEAEPTPVILGYINLQTGKCTKGKGVTAKDNS